MVFQNFLLAPGVCKIPLQGRRSMRSRAHVLLPDRLAWLSLRIAAASATLAELMEGGIAFALPFRSRGLARLAGGRALFGALAAGSPADMRRRHVSALAFCAIDVSCVSYP